MVNNLEIRPNPEVIKLFFMLNSTEFEFFLVISFKMPTLVGILKFITRTNVIICCS